MPRRPGDEEPEPPGGRAAERLREFIDQRYPEGLDNSVDKPKEEPAGPGGEDAVEDGGGEDAGGEDPRPEDRR